MITRRAFLSGAALSLALVSLRAVGGQAPVRIGWLNTGSRTDSDKFLVAFKEALAALGWKEGSSYVIEERWAAGRQDLLPTLAAELAAKNPALIVAAPTTAAAAAAKAAPGMPVVHASGGDMLGTGLVASLARPGGTITGLSGLSTQISEKYLELLLAAVPTLRRVGILIDSRAVTGALHKESTQRSAAQVRFDARFAEAGLPAEIEPAMVRLEKEGVQGLIVTPSVLFTTERRSIHKRALANGWPTIGSGQLHADAGALLSYGIDIPAIYRRAAFYVDRILKGAKPGDLPIEQPTKFELVINLKTAKALGLAIPQEFLLRVDKVIE